MKQKELQTGKFKYCTLTGYNHDCTPQYFNLRALMPVRL